MDERLIGHAVLPEEVSVDQEQDIAHDRARHEETAIEYEMETDDIQRDWKEKQSGQRFALGPQTDKRDDEDDRHHDGDVLRVHHDLDILKRLVGIIEVACRGWEHTGRAENRHDEHQAQQDFQNDMDDFLDLHRVVYGL